MKQFLFASVASVIVAAFMSDAALEVVTVVGEDGEPLRINKTDYVADQASDEPRYTLHAAPAAPDFSAGTGAPEPIDPHKNAVKPGAPSPGQKLVQKNGTGKNAKFIIVVAQGDGTFAPLTNAMLTEAHPNNTPTIEEGGYATDKDAWTAIMALPS